MVRKTKFLSISVLVSEIDTLCLKRKVLYEFPQKCFKTTKRPSLAVCGLVYGEKQFLLIFIPFYWFDQKKLFKQIQIFHRINPIWKMVRKTNFCVFQCFFFEIVTFLTKKEVLYEFPQKCFQTTERYSLAVCCSHCGEDQFLLIIIPFNWFVPKKLFKQIQIFLRFGPFQIWKGKQIFWVFQCSFLR